MGIGDWGLGIGDWGLGPIPNPQSPIPNPLFNNLKTKYHKKYFESMVEQFTADPKLSPTMIKFVPAMCDEVNMGISLTEEGCRYLNNQYKPTICHVNTRISFKG